MILNRFVVMSRYGTGMNALRQFNTQDEAVNYIKQSLVDEAMESLSWHHEETLFDELSPLYEAGRMDVVWDKLVDADIIGETQDFTRDTIFSYALTRDDDWSEYVIEPMQIELTQDEAWKTYKEHVVSWIRNELNCSLKHKGYVLEESTLSELTENSFNKYCREGGTVAENYISVMNEWLDNQPFPGIASIKSFER